VLMSPPPAAKLVYCFFLPRAFSPSLIFPSLQLAPFGFLPILRRESDSSFRVFLRWVKICPDPAGRPIFFYALPLCDVTGLFRVLVHP